jgi:putative oxidoreductase
MTDGALLLLRLTVGGLLAGHGAQKLFGSFEGPGLHGTSNIVESMGYRPGQVWATAAAAGELGGGVLTGLGLLSPLGPLGAMSVMATATAKVHWGKPVWVTSGGAELPLTNMAAAGAIALAGPGRWSLDRLLGIRLPGWFSFLSLIAAAAMTAKGIADSNRAQQQPPAPAAEEAPAEQRVSEPVSPSPEVTQGS